MPAASAVFGVGFLESGLDAGMTTVIGSIGFVTASVACAFAATPAMLIGFRLAQGAAAALLIPQGLGIVRDAFAPRDLQSAFAVFGPVIGLSAVLGPIVGGALIAANAFGSGWRLIFFVNLPLGLIAAIGAARLMPESRSPPSLAPPSRRVSTSSERCSPHWEWACSFTP